MSAGSERRRILRIRDGVREEKTDLVAAEAALVIEVDGVIVSTTMRTPGHDIELTLGWLLSEGVITSADDVLTAQECVERPQPDEEARRVKVTTRFGRAPAPRLTPTSSACGICGSDLVERTLADAPWPLADDRDVFELDVVLALPDALRASQRGFANTGGSHAAALFDRNGNLLVAREDVGRHNAVDKALGWALAQRKLPARGCALQVSGRASAELVHKAVRAGVPLLAAVSAPSTLAIDLARAAGLTLVGFSRGTSANVYSSPERIG